MKPKNYPFSYRDLSSSKVFNFAPGVLYPAKFWDVLPGDKWNIGVRAAIESWPMLAPTIGEWKASFDFYFEPWENLYGWMDGNYRMSAREYMEQGRWTHNVGLTALGITKLNIAGTTYLYPVVQPGSMWDFLEITPGFFGVVEGRSDGTYNVRTLTVNMEDWISYVDIFRNYYANPQETTVPFTSAYMSGHDTEDSLNQFNSFDRVPLVNLDKFMMDLRASSPQDGLDEIVGSHSLSDFLDSAYVRLGGFFLRTYKMDLLRGVMNANVGDYESTVEPDENGNISVTAFRTASGVQDMINEIDVSGGRFDRVQEMRWGKSPKKHLDRPIYLGSVSQTIGQRDIVSTAAGVSEVVQSDGTVAGSILGQQAGFTVGAMRGNKRKINLNAGGSYGTLVCIFSLVPIVYYSGGIPLRKIKDTFADIFDPALARIGYQPVSVLELKATPVGIVNYRDSEVGSNDIAEFVISDEQRVDVAVAKRIAWSEYMADLNRAHGDFALGQSLDYWTFNRVYASHQYQRAGDSAEAQFDELYGHLDTTTYVKPSLWNRLFVDQKPDAMNFRLRVAFDVDVIREIPKQVMPK